MPPVVSCILISVFFVLFVCCVIADRNSSSLYTVKFELDHPYRASLGGMHLSKQDELIWEFPCGRSVGYKVWNIADVGYVEMHTGAAKQTEYYAFRILDRDRHILKGKYYTPSRRPVYQHARRTFDVPDEKSLNDVARFVMLYGKNVEKVAAEDEN